MHFVLVQECRLGSRQICFVTRYRLPEVERGGREGERWGGFQPDLHTEFHGYQYQQCELSETSGFQMSTCNQKDGTAVLMLLMEVVKQLKPRWELLSTT